MLKYFFSLVFSLIIFSAFAQPKTSSSVRVPGCQSLSFDLETGTINGIGPTAGMSMVKKQFPCFTGESEEGGPFNCGGGVFFLKHDFYYYTGRNYIEVREDFKGTVTDDLLKKTRADITKIYGKPSRIENVDAIYIYDMPYGALLFVFDGDEVVTISAHAAKAKDVELCY